MEKFMLIFQAEITGKTPSPQQMQEIDKILGR